MLHFPFFCNIFLSTDFKVDWRVTVHEASKTELFEQWCRQRGERCTTPRRAILEAVLEFGNHPTAEQVFEAVRPRLPAIARPTVYRTLEHLARAGVITKACHPGAICRYDSRIDLHHHLVCLRCNQIVDFEDPSLDTLTIPDTSEFGFEVSDYRVQIRGL